MLSPRHEPVSPVSEMPGRRERDALTKRALLLWPRLERRRLRRVCDDPSKVARLVAHRSALSLETIHAMLIDLFDETSAPLETARLGPLSEQPSP